MPNTSRNNESAGSTTRRIQTVDGPALEIRIPGLRAEAVSGSSAGRRWFFTHDRIRIGSSPESDIQLEDETVSRNHAVLRVSIEGLLVEDGGSTNGTYLEGVRVREAFLEPGKEIRFGQTRMVFSPHPETFVSIDRPRESYGGLVGSSAPMRELYALIDAVAQSTASVLLEGESGTGKELVARALHERSCRPGILVAYDCANATREMLRSELFGHKKGAFTGAENERPGAFRRAHRGTLMLDELGELDEGLQSTLLRALESREVLPVGSDDPVPVDVRFLGATHRPLCAFVDERRFRLDLYHRLNVINITIPPLRERREDISLLVDHFARDFNASCRFGGEAMSVLMTHSWPGNVRELRNAVERASLLVKDREVTARDLAFLGGTPGTPSTQVESPGAPILQDVQRVTLLRVLEQHGGNRVETAQALGISLSTLKRRLREYGVK